MNRIIIAGGRDFINYSLLEFEVKKFIVEHNLQLPIEIVSGHARGADTMGERFAHKYKLDLKIFPAEWDKYGNRAGPIRNEEMAKYCELQYAIIFWDGQSSGSKNMIENSKKYNLTYKIVRYENHL